MNMRVLVVGLVMVLALFASISSSLKHGNINLAINAVIKNEALNNLNQSPDNLSEKEKIQAHLLHVYQILKDQTGKVENQYLKLKRKAALASLMKYIRAGEFPRNTSYKGRRPCFVDENNNLCAVAYLLHSAGKDKLIEKINNQFQYEYIHDINLPEFLAWVKTSGFTLKDLATIQPAYGHWTEPKFNHQISARSIRRETSTSYFSVGYSRVKVKEYSGKFLKQWHRNIGVNFEDYHHSNFAISGDYDKTFFSFKAWRIPVLFQYGFRPRYFNFNGSNGLNLEPYAKSIIPIRIKHQLMATVNASYGHDIPIVGDTDFLLSRKMLSIGLSIAYMR